jgi:hypothetical protein
VLEAHDQRQHLSKLRMDLAVLHGVKPAHKDKDKEARMVSKLQNECWPAIRCSWFVQGNNEHACLWRGAGPRSCLAGYGRERVYVPQPLCEAHWAIGPWQTAELLDAAHALPFTFSERSLAPAPYRVQPSVH